MLRSAMRALLAALAIAYLASPAFCEDQDDGIVYVSADGKGGYDADGLPRDPKGRTLDAVLKAAGELAMDKPVTIQLLTSKRFAATVYQTTPATCVYAMTDIRRPAGKPLTIQGIHVNDKYLVEIAGISVTNVIQRKGLCTQETAAIAGGSDDSPTALAEPADGKNVHPDDLLRALAAVGGRFRLRHAAGSPRNLTRCFDIHNSEFLIFKDLHFKDCWLSAINVADSKNITLRDSLIEGSTYAFFAVSSPENDGDKETGHITIDPQKSSGFVISHVDWYQDTSGFGPEKEPGCREPNTEAPCPGEIWTTIPWGVTHDTVYDYMNGALFGSQDIAGDVTFENNNVLYAYNGIHMNVSSQCNALPSCRGATNRNVRIVDNNFMFNRDNPIEPEVRAENWRIHGNVFRNSHGWLSFDNVADGPIYVWSNTGYFDSIPSQRCKDETSAYLRRRQKVDFENGGYRSFAGPTENLHCAASTRGTVLKVGDVGGPKAKEIYIFHNSWMIRAPLVNDGQTGTIHHWDNAIQFTGCGAKGPAQCRVVPAPDLDPACPSMKSYYTAGNNSIALACVDKRQVASTAYDFRFDISNQSFPPILRDEPKPPLGKNGFDLKFEDASKGRFTLRPGSDAIGAGCRVTALSDGKGALTCEPVRPNEAPVDVGAFNADGSRYEAPAIN